METIRFVDTTIRDGHQSLWAENMTTGMMLPIAERLDDAGFEGIELLSGSHLKKAVRELREDPWDRVRLISQRVKKTPLRLIAGRVNTFELRPPSMYQLFIERMAANGIRQARISDEWNDLEAGRFASANAHAAGLEPIVNLIYSVSPKHSDDYYRRASAQAASLDRIRLCLKDPGGLLTPERTRTLVPLIFHECKWNSGRTAHPLHDRVRPALLRSRPCNSAFGSINTACRPGRRLIQSFAFQRRAKCARPRVHARDRRGGPAAGDEHFNVVANAKDFPSACPPNTTTPIPAPGPGRNDLQSRPQLRKVGLESKLAAGAGREYSGARRIRLSDHGDAAFAVRRQPGGHQRHRRRTLQGGYGSGDSIRSRPLRRGRSRRPWIPNVKDKILDRPRAKELAANRAAGTVDPTKCATQTRRRGLRRRVAAALGCPPGRILKPCARPARSRSI